MWDRPQAFDRRLLEFVEEADHSGESGSEVARSFDWDMIHRQEGLSYRQSGRQPRVILLHGLGLSGRYFAPLAAALREHDLDAVAPDFPGFGAAIDEAVLSPDESAERLLKWAKSVGILNPIWVGHSTGAASVVRLRAMTSGPDAHFIFIGPIWSDHRGILELFGRIAVDALREPLRLISLVIVEYWSTGLARCLRELRLTLKNHKSPADLGQGDLVIIGERDPLADRTFLEKECGGRLRDLPGAHAVNFSNPRGVARLIAELVGS